MNEAAGPSSPIKFFTVLAIIQDGPASVRSRIEMAKSSSCKRHRFFFLFSVHYSFFLCFLRSSFLAATSFFLLLAWPRLPVLGKCWSFPRQSFSPIPIKCRLQALREHLHDLLTDSFFLHWDQLIAIIQLDSSSILASSLPSSSSPVASTLSSWTWVGCCQHLLWRSR